MKEQVQNMNFFKRLWTSIKDFEKYEEFAAERLLKAIKYMLTITLLFTLIVTSAYTYKFYLTVQNVRNLHLSDEIIDTVKKGKFHIYAISTIDEGIEILTGVPAGKKNKDGKFPLGTINYLAEEKLKKYYLISSNKTANN